MEESAKQDGTGSGEIKDFVKRLHARYEDLVRDADEIIEKRHSRIFYWLSRLLNKNALMRDEYWSGFFVGATLLLYEIFDAAEELGIDSGELDG